MNDAMVSFTRVSQTALQPETRGDSMPRPQTTAPRPSLPRIPQGSDVATPLETINSVSEMDALMMEALANGDPSVLMSGIATRLRKATISTAESDIRGNQASERAHTTAQVAAYQRASEAQKTASQWATVAKVGAYVAASLAIVVGVAGAVYSGGVTTLGGIALACVIVSSAATIGVMAAQDLGAFHGEAPPKWLTISIAVVALLGAVCSLGASSASAVATVGAAVSVTAQAASIVADVGTECHWWHEPPPAFRLALAGLSLAGSITSVSSGVGAAGKEMVGIVGKTVSATAELARGTALVTQGAATMGAAAMNYQSDIARLDGDHHKNQRGTLRMQDEDLVEAMRYAMKSYRRTIRIASDTQQETSSARVRMTGNFARA